MLNRTIGRLCGFFLLTYQPGIRLEFLAFSYFCFFVFLLFAPARAGLAGGPANTSVVSSG